jgi:hypothetical protein
MKAFLLFVLCALVLVPQLGAKDENGNEAIIAAAKTYVAANSAIAKFTVTVEQVEGDFARAKVTPENASAADPAWVFLKKEEGKWRGLALGTSFTVSDYQELGIPNALRVP